jgi:tellurite resistance protein TerC
MVWIWCGFIVFVLAILALDLGVFHRRAHVVSIREALAWSAVWVTLGIAFSVFVYFAYENHWFGIGLTPDAVGGQLNNGYTATLKYLTGYVIEKSLSVDNIFVMAMIFGFLAVPPIYQHRVLYWGILGALVMRGVMIGIGAELISRYHWILYLFGGFLVITAVKMLVIKEHSDPAQNFAVRWAKRLFPVTDRFHGQHFFVRAGSGWSHEAAVPGEAPVPDAAVERATPGTLMLTPLAIALILVETTDLIFAVDSIPAIFAITADPFLVFASNVFAILGLRSLYFALAGMMDKFRFLKVSLATILAIVGLKMLLAEPLKDALGPGFNLYLLLVVVVILASGILASLYTGPELEPREVLANPQRSGDAPAGDSDTDWTAAWHRGPVHRE